MAGLVGDAGVLVQPSDGGIPTEVAGKVADWQNAGGPVVIFTFDDGPSKTLTPRLLAILAKHNIKAAFFVLGEMLRDGGIEIMKMAANQGHQIGNHSFSHSDLRKLSEDKIKAEIENTQALIGSCASPKKYFRPPYGATDAHVKAVAAAGDYTTVLWDVDTEDWKLRNASWIDLGLKQIKRTGRSIVLNHDIHATTVDNFDAFILAIKKQFPQAIFAQLA
jgi:peptidoglycan/xylan/chitin deacetylase (PgdA/CDA1 family)